MVSLDDDFETLLLNKRKDFDLPIYTLQSNRPQCTNRLPSPPLMSSVQVEELVLTHKVCKYNTSNSGNS